MDYEIIRGRMRDRITKGYSPPKRTLDTLFDNIDEKETTSQKIKKAVGWVILIAGFYGLVYWLHFGKGILWDIAMIFLAVYGLVLIIGVGIIAPIMIFLHHESEQRKSIDTEVVDE